MDQGVAPDFQMTVIVPCYNEAKRFDLNYWEYIVGATQEIRWIFVDDGSSDHTSELLSAIPGGVKVKRLSNNLGKAEALRWGFQEAILHESEVIGFIDADQSFDRDEVVQICKKFKQKTEWTSSNQNYMAVFMSRSFLLNEVETFYGAFRKYFGTLVSKIYSAIWSELPPDTQCGFKFFISDNTLALAMSTAFANSWFFEIETMMRIRIALDNPLVIKVVPLRYWIQVEGSSTDKSNTLNSAWQIVRTFFKLISFRVKTL